MSYAELDRASDAFAARLQAIGVKKGEPVVLFLNNCPQYLVGALRHPEDRRHRVSVRAAEQGARAGVPGQRPEGARDRRGRVLLPVVDKVRASERAGTRVRRCTTPTCCPTSPTLDLPAELAAAQREPRSVPAGCEDFLAVMQSGARAAPRRDLDGRRGAHDLHLGHHRPAQGRDAELRQRALQDARRGRLQRRRRERRAARRSRRCITSPAC